MLIKLKETISLVSSRRNARRLALCCETAREFLEKHQSHNPAQNQLTKREQRTSLAWVDLHGCDWVVELSFGNKVWVMVGTRLRTATAECTQTLDAKRHRSSAALRRLCLPTWPASNASFPSITTFSIACENPGSTHQSALALELVQLLQRVPYCR